LELDILFKQSQDSLLDKLKHYREKRVDELAKIHSKFSRGLGERELFNLQECVSRMTLGLSPPKITVGMDFQLFDIETDNDNSKTIVAINPVARDAIITYHGKGLFPSLALVAEVIFSGREYTNDFKGRLTEKYITTVIEIQKRFMFQFRVTTDSGLLNSISTFKNIEIIDVLHFTGNKLPQRSSFDSLKTTLFIPKSSNYPGFDFLIWESNGILSAYQVTVMKPFTSHQKINAASDHCKSWLDFCFEAKDKNPIEIYWIIPQSCLGTPRNSGINLILIDEMYDDFPAFKKLNL